MPKISQLTKRTRAAKIVSGIEEHFSPTSKHRLDGKSYSRKALIALFQAHVDAIDEIRRAHAALAIAVRSEQAIAKRTRTLALYLKGSVSNELGPQVLWAFGWTEAKKPGPKTTAAKAAGAEKMRATRKARHTMGSRQRKKIRGSLADTTRGDAGNE